MEWRQRARRAAALVMCLIMFTGMTAAYADTLAYTDKKTTVYVKKSGKMKKAGTIAKGEEVTVLDSNGKWVKIEQDGKAGYVKITYLVPEEMQDEANGKTVRSKKSAYAVERGVKVYEFADDESDVLTTLAWGKKVTMLAYNDVWCMIKTGSKYGYVLREDLSVKKIKVTKSSKNVYAAKDGVKVYASCDEQSDVLDTLELGRKLKMTAYSSDWCLIKSGDKYGYVLRDEVSLKKVAPKKEETAEKVTKCNKTVYVAVDDAKVYASASESAKVQDELNKGQKLTMTAYSDTWCLVKSGSKAGYMLRKDISLEKVSETQPTPAPTATPKPENVTKCDKTGYAVADDVKVYAEADTDSNVIASLSKNASVNVIGYSDKWCQVKNGKYIGYVRMSDLSETKAPELPAELQYGDTGEPVKLLQTRLKELGYFSGSIGGNYLAQTRTAVLSFQSQNNLETDGTAGPQTLALLFSDKAQKYDPSKDKQESTGGSTTSGPSNGLVQEMDWWTSDIQKIFARGTTATVTDCSTGISWKERRNGGSNHADVQPVTAADTAAMKSAVGSWSWDRRAIWVTIGGKNYAASMNCMPHGSGSITDNNFGGHHCIHFTNSRTHGTNKVCSLHQAAIKKALKYNPDK